MYNKRNRLILTAILTCLYEMLPVYAESFDIRQEGVVTITMVNAVYEVVTNGTNTGRINEKNKQQFNDEITIEHSIGFAKNKPQLDIQFVPLKKNKLTVR